MAARGSVFARKIRLRNILGRMILLPYAEKTRDWRFPRESWRFPARRRPAVGPVDRRRPVEIRSRLTSRDLVELPQLVELDVGNRDDPQPVREEESDGNAAVGTGIEVKAADW